MNKTLTVLSCNKGLQILFVGFLLPSLLYFSTKTVDSESTKDKALKIFDDLQSEDEFIRFKATTRILKDRKNVIAQLVTMVNPENSAKYSLKTRAAAAYLLGEFRAKEGVKVLSKSLSEKLPLPIMRERIGLGASFRSALMSIGRPCVPTMITNIETIDLSTNWTKSLAVLFHVLGGKSRLLELLNKIKIQAGNDKEKLSRINRAIEWVEEHYKDGKDPLY